MKKAVLLLVLILCSFTSCVAQKVDPPVEKVLPNALVTQVIEERATLNYLGRTFETDGTYVKGRRYYVILEVVDCHNCDIVQAVTKVKETSVPQAKEDIQLALYKLKQSKKNFKND